mgnify:CR=1 FL=1
MLQTTIDMHKVLIGIGTNSDANSNMKLAINYLLSYFPNIKFTNWIETQPFGVGFTAPFLNALAYLKTDMDREQLQQLLKTIERDMGRLPSHKKEGKIIIDIDLIKYDGDILKPDDFRHDYMQQLLEEIKEIM